MKKLSLAGIAALFLATGSVQPAHAINQMTYKCPGGVEVTIHLHKPLEENGKPTYEIETTGLHKPSHRVKFRTVTGTLPNGMQFGRTDAYLNRKLCKQVKNQ
jgi:hypothetical protein